MGMVIMLLITLFLWSRGPIAAFKPWYEWFDQWDPKKQHRCLPPMLMAYFYGPVFMYDIAKLVSKEGTVPHDWYIDFIMSVMRAFGRGVIPGNKDAILVPRNICVSLAPDESDSDDAVAMMKAVRLEKGTPVTVNDGKTTYTAQGTFNGTWPTDAESWRVLMCGGDDIQGWGCNYSIDSNSWTGDQKTWESSPTNFLWKFYAIPYDSALIKGFITNTSDFQGLKLFPDAMNPLLGVSLNQAEGGWLGFLKGGDRWGDFNSLMVQAYVWADALRPKTPATSPCSNPAEFISSGLSFGLMAGPMFWAAPEVTGAKAMAGAIGKALLGAGVAAGVGGTVGAVAQGCHL
jgi:hypothetical protein